MANSCLAEKKFPLMILVLLVLFLITSVAGGEVQKPAQARTLRLSTMYPKAMRDSGPLLQFVKDVETFTNGAIKIKVYWMGELAQVAELADLCRTGGLEMATIVPFYYASLFPLGVATQAYTPVTKTPEQAAYAWRSLQRDVPAVQQQYTKQNMYVLNRKGFAPYRIISKKPLRHMADLKGLSIRMGGTYMEAFFKAAGANTKKVPYPDIYEALMRGLLDGVMVDSGAMVGLKLYEVGKYVSSPIGAIIGYGLVINLDVWKAFTPDIKKGLERAATEWGKNDLQMTLQTEESSNEILKKNGVQFVDFDKKDFEAMLAAAGSPWEHCKNWLVTDMKVDKQVADQFVKHWQGAIEEYERKYLATGKKWEYQ
jgi:TRAP-type C4-dicarboxylate transport system substrate-binding protein